MTQSSAIVLAIYFVRLFELDKRDEHERRLVRSQCCRLITHVGSRWTSGAISQDTVRRPLVRDSYVLPGGTNYLDKTMGPHRVLIILVSRTTLSLEREQEGGGTNDTFTRVRRTFAL